MAAPDILRRSRIASLVSGKIRESMGTPESKSERLGVLWMLLSIVFFSAKVLLLRGRLRFQIGAMRRGEREKDPAALRRPPDPPRYSPLLFVGSLGTPAFPLRAPCSADRPLRRTHPLRWMV